MISRASSGWGLCALIACGGGGGDDAANATESSAAEASAVTTDTDPEGVDTGSGSTAASDASDTTGSVPSCVGLGDRPAACPARGVYDEPVDIELAAFDDASPIYYTLDGTTPSAQNGTLYDGPITIAGTPDAGVVVVRAWAGRSVATHSYVFPEHVLAQPAAPDGVPTTWGSDPEREGDYEMDPDVLVDAATEAHAIAALRAIPTISIVMEPDDLWDPAAGIYMNPEQEGVEWERPSSAELIFGDQNPQIDCGIRIQGGSSTSGWKSAKLSMRLLFKKIYGAGKLEFPLFPDSPVTKFDSLVLDAHLNLTWVHPNHDQRIRSQYVRDQYVSDLQNEVGSLAPHGRFFHLYLNGLYWGVYDVHERPDASFAAQHLGGDKLDYDSLKHDGQTVLEGDATAWDAMFSLARSGLAEDASYAAIQEYLDLDDFIDYMIVNLYTGNTDWPHHNWYTARRRAAGAGFRFFSWDAEHVLKDVGQDNTGVDDPGSPGELLQALLDNAGFRERFGARAAELLAPGAALSPERAAELYEARAQEVHESMWCESARWGDNRREEPYGVADWEAELGWLRTTYFPARTAVVAGQLNP